MATLNDFVVNRGLVVNTQAIINGVDVLANDGVTLLSAYANDGITLTTALANDYNTYTTLNGRIDTVQNNVGSIVANYSANDYSTWLAAMANDGVTLATAIANDYSTYTTLVSEYRANDYSTWLSAMSNDGSTLTTALANDYSTYTTLANEYSANDYSTYTTLLNGYRANDYATWVSATSFTNIKANSDVNVISGDGLDGGGPLTSNITLSVDSTVVRTTGAQNINGLKTFTDSVIISGDLTVQGNTTTIGTTNLLVEDKFIELASNTTGTPSGDVGIYLNRGDQGNSAIYYDQSEGYFSLVNTLDPATNTVVSPTSFAALKVGTILVSNTQVVTNLNADQLDGQDGSYYLDFGNSTNTNLITLDRVLANGNSSSHSISVGGLTVDSNTLHVDSTNNFVGIRTLTPLAPLQIEVVGIATSTLPTTANTANQVLDTFSAASFRTAKYTIQIHDTANNYYHSCEILLIHDGTTVHMTEYAIIFTNTSLASFNADIVGGSVRLLVTPINTTNTIRVVRSALAV